MQLNQNMMQQKERVEIDFLSVGVGALSKS